MVVSDATGGTGESGGAGVSACPDTKHSDHSMDSSRPRQHDHLKEHSSHTKVSDRRYFKPASADGYSAVAAAATYGAVPNGVGSMNGPNSCLSDRSLWLKHEQEAYVQTLRLKRMLHL